MLLFCLWSSGVDAAGYLVNSDDMCGKTVRAVFAASGVRSMLAQLHMFAPLVRPVLSAWCAVFCGVAVCLDLFHWLWAFVANVCGRHIANAVRGGHPATLAALVCLACAPGV